MPQITLDDSLFPLVIQRMHGAVSDADLEHMMSWHDRFQTIAPSRYALIVHAEVAHRALNAVHRKRVAEWQARNVERTRRTTVCTAVILESAVQRGAMTALNWIAPPPTPQKAVSTMREAVEWCIAMLEEDGVSVPSSVHRFRSDLVAGVKRA